MLKELRQRVEGRPERVGFLAASALCWLTLVVARTRLAPSGLHFLASPPLWKWIVRAFLLEGCLFVGLWVFRPSEYLSRLSRSSWRSFRYLAPRLTVSVVSLVVALKLIDMAVVASRTGRIVVYDGSLSFEPSAREFYVYPYTGCHLSADRHYVGPMPYERPYEKEGPRTVFDVQMGSHGFWVDFDLESPPAKRDREFRILYTGGSTAQGWGATTNEHMVARVLERNLQALFAPRGIPVRVVNLAMGGSTTYQNFIALNRWGHALDPDLILSFSGGNDFGVPIMTESDAYLLYGRVRALTDVTHVECSPSWLKTLYKAFPSLVELDESEACVKETTRLGLVVRSLYGDELTREAKERYREASRRGSGDADRSWSEPLYVHALCSIKRDFPGVPVLVAFQPYQSAAVSAPWDQELGWTVETSDARYEEFIEHARRAVADYQDHEWAFVDLNRLFHERGLYDPVKPLPFRVHLDDAQQKNVADMLTEPVAEIIRRKRGGAEPSPSGGSSR